MGGEEVAKRGGGASRRTGTPLMTGPLKSWPGLMKPESFVFFHNFPRPNTKRERSRKKRGRLGESRRRPTPC